MATKYLARTVIEGGRCRFNKRERRNSNRRARRKSRAYTHAVRYDPEWGEGSVAPGRSTVWRCHADKLAAAERWLASFVGARWDWIYAEICRRFDVRTIAGQHIVYDHLLPSVQIGDCAGWCRHDFHVDVDGLLRPLPQSILRRRRPASQKLPVGKARRSWPEIHDWSRGRKVGRRGEAWFWFEPTGGTGRECEDPWCSRLHVEDASIGGRRHHEPNGHYRQAGRLDPADVRLWNQLMPDVQNDLSFDGTDGPPSRTNRGRGTVESRTP